MSYLSITVKMTLLTFVCGVTFWSLTSTKAEDQSAQKPNEKTQEGIAFFNKKILPVLIKECYECHSSAILEPKGELRVDSRLLIRKGGESGRSVVPKDLDESLIIDAIKHESFEMPPEKKLSAAVIKDFETWIKMGAPDPRDKAPNGAEAEKMMGKLKSEELKEFWSLKPIQPWSPPLGKHNQWSRHPVDCFIHEALLTKGLKPSGPADRRTLIRRASIILTGLPPTPEEVKNFLEDTRTAESAYSDLVDRLIASKQFGERWGQHWLDNIRFSETSGSESNLYRTNAWWYRDYVVRSLNEDKPFNQFLKEQIAGDVYGADEATGFLVSGPHVYPPTVGREPSAILQARYDRLDEVMQNVGASLFGTTLGCARCHNHKFDAVSTQDYYSLVAIFQDIEFGHRMPKLTKEHPRKVRGEQLTEQIETIRKELKKSSINNWSENWVSHVQVHFPKTKAKFVKVSFLTGFTRLDELEVYDSSTGGNNLALASQGTKIKTFNMNTQVRSHPDWLLDGDRQSFWGWAAKPKEPKKPAGVILHLPQEQEIERIELSSDRATVVETDYLAEKNIGKFYFSRYIIETSLDGKTWQQAASTETEKKLPATERDHRKQLVTKINQLAKTYFKEGPQEIFSGRFIPPASTHVLHRGDPAQPGELVKPETFSIFNSSLSLSDKSTGPERRVAFANWVVGKENPLTLRVSVNRLWKHVFGNGLVNTMDDFGHAGAKPTHPLLLDWLANEYRNNGWSTKKLLRMLVMSKTFRQSSQQHQQGLKVDANAQYLWRYPIQRIDAEALRDSILDIAGSLDKRIGGKGYRIHADKKRYASWKVSDNAAPQTWRRLIYQERMRGIDDKMFMAFDLPDCKQVSSKRPVSTTPIQALNLFNGDLVITQSKKLAARIEKEAGTNVEAQVKRMFLRVLCREPRADELKFSVVAVKQDGLPHLARVLFNTNEFSFLK